MISDNASTTSIDEIGDRVYRISIPMNLPNGVGFTFNQYLLVDEAPLLFHTGLRRQFPLVRDAVARVMPVDRLRYVSFSHFEADECGALNEWLAAAPGAEPLCGRIAAMTSVNDAADRPAKVLADGATVSLGTKTVRWIDTPHVPHGWESGMLFEERTRTLLSSDLFTQGGASHPPVTEGDILGPSEKMRASMDYYAHGPGTRPTLERLAALGPSTLACMHGPAWRGDGARLIRALADALEERG